MEWNIYLCPNEDCTVEAWLVQPDPTRTHTWQVADRWSEQTYTMVTPVPLCPRCAATLCTHIEPEAHDTTPIFDEVIAERLLALLDTGHVRPLSELTFAIAKGGDTRPVRRTLDTLVHQGVVALRGERRGLWYRGYALNQDKQSDDVPAAFQALLRQLVG